jgi:aminopeptidase N
MEKIRIFVALLGVFLITACMPRAGIEQTPTPNNSRVTDFEIPWVESEYQDRAWLQDSYALTRDLSSATEYLMEVNITDSFETVSGQMQIRYTNNEAEPLEDIYLRLFPNLAGGKARVHSLTVDGRSIEPAYEAEDSAVRISLTQALAPDESARLALEFSTSIPRQMEGNYGLFGYFDGFLVLDTFYPMIPVYDADGWQREATPPNGDPTYNDISFYLVRVQAPVELTLFATGIEVDREVVADQQIVTYASGPARDFYIAAAEDLEVVEEQVGETLIRSFAPANYMENAELALRAGANALISFERNFGEYPYPEMELISTPMQALGIEYPGIMAMNLDLYDPDGSIQGVPSRIYLESTVAHEVAHQWFYNIVGNDQVEQPWLDEALAQYATYLYYLDTYSNEAASSYQQSWYDRWDRTDRVDKPIGLPAGEYERVEYGSIVYGRGPIFISELAEIIGSESMEAFLQNYVRQHAWGIATAESFQNAAEKACSCDLDELFREWVYPES